jgi:hypothetical protein
MGDLNFRVESERAMIDQKIGAYRKAVEEGDEELVEKILESMLAMDQLRSCQLINEVLQKYEEPEIDFLPTYKFDKGTSVYDTSEKQRIPSWTDRVLIGTKRGSRNYKCLFYGSVEGLLQSDHKFVSLDDR